MADTLTKARKPQIGPTHYETLGVSPKATSDEVTHAFAARMSSLTPRSVALLAQISVAYETLRDPEKRRIYDASLRPMAKPGYSFRWTVAPAPSAGQALVDRMARPSSDLRPKITPLAEVKEETAIPAPAVSSPPKHQVEQHLRTGQRPALAFETMVTEKRRDRRSRSRYDEASIDWKRIAAAAGWPVLGVAIMGGVVGWSASIVEQPQPAGTLKIALPRLEQQLETAGPSMPPPPVVTAEVSSVPSQRRDAVSATRVGLERPKPGETKMDTSDIPQDVEVALTPPADRQTSTEAAAAPMPLSDSTIARTIGRIGYACGKVASTRPVDEAFGVFKVTCSSGDSYRASPVRGRYHFRRWAGD